MFAKKQKSGISPITLILIFIVLVSALILGIYQRRHQNVPDYPISQVYLNEQTCADAGGMWDACGSACRGQAADACIQVCVEYCNCVSNSQCPYGYECGDVVNGTGICKVKK